MLQSCLHQLRFASSQLGNSTTTTSLAPLLLHFAPLCSTFSLQYSTELTPLLHYPTPLAPQLLSYINSPIFRFGALKLDLLLICIYCCYLVVLLTHSLYVYYSLLLIYMIISVTTSTSTGVTRNRKAPTTTLTQHW